MVDDSLESRARALRFALAEWGGWWVDELSSLSSAAMARWSRSGSIAELVCEQTIDGARPDPRAADASAVVVRIGHNGTNDAPVALQLAVPLAEVSEAQAAELRRVCSGCRVHVLLPRQDVHWITTRVPQAALNEEALRYALALQAPVQIDSLALAWRPSAARAEDLLPGWTDLDVAMCRRSVLAAVLATLERCGLSAERIGAAAPEDDRSAVPPEAQAQLVFWQRTAEPTVRSGIVYAACIMAAFLLGPLAVGLLASMQATRLQSATAAVQEQQSATLALAQRRANVLALQSALRRADAQPRTTAVLEDHAARFGDDVWLQEVRLDGTQIAVLGQTTQPRVLVPALSASPLLGDVRLVSVSAAAQASERVGFELTAVLRPRPQ
jgi:hypothetical protein